MYSFELSSPPETSDLLVIFTVETYRLPTQIVVRTRLKPDQKPEQGFATVEQYGRFLM